MELIKTNSNLAVETSDNDYFGVYEGHIDDVLSVMPPPDTFDSHDPDYSVYEAKVYHNYNNK